MKIIYHGSDHLLIHSFQSERTYMSNPAIFWIPVFTICFPLANLMLTCTFTINTGQTCLRFFTVKVTSILVFVFFWFCFSDTNDSAFLETCKMWPTFRLSLHAVSKIKWEVFQKNVWKPVLISILWRKKINTVMLQERGKKNNYL